MAVTCNVDQIPVATLSAGKAQEIKCVKNIQEIIHIYIKYLSEILHLSTFWEDGLKLWKIISILYAFHARICLHVLAII